MLLLKWFNYLVIAVTQNVVLDCTIIYILLITEQKGMSHLKIHTWHFFTIKPTRCTNFTNLFWHETLHVSDSSSVHHQEFIHCTLSNGICHTSL